jgi:hypothetical protein
MAIGMMVLGRITKTEQDNTRFHFSLRKSIVVYGVGQVVRTDLSPGQEVSAIILAHAAENVAFGQIKGSYYKLKVKQVPSSKTTGVVCKCKLTKVEKDKIVAEFASFDTQAKEEAHEKVAEKAFKSVWKTAQTDIKQLLAAQDTQDKGEKEENKLEQMLGTK